MGCKKKEDLNIFFQENIIFANFTLTLTKPLRQGHVFYN